MWNKNWGRRRKTGGVAQKKLSPAEKRRRGLWESCDKRTKCVTAHMPVHVLRVKLMEIESLKALSPFFSGGQSMSMQTKTKPSQPVSLPFIIVRTTAAVLPVSPQNPPSVHVCF